MIELHRFKMLNSKCRSTPCPNVKHGDEWGEPSKCESGDSCQYCHSRTEQQFHPEVRRSTMACCSRTREMKTVGVFQFARHQNSHDKELFITCFFFKIYKSTKCNDMRQTGYCPRGPFCAFAHVESKWRFISTFQRWEKKENREFTRTVCFCFVLFVLSFRNSFFRGDDELAADGDTDQLTVSAGPTTILGVSSQWVEQWGQLHHQRNKLQWTSRQCEFSVLVLLPFSRPFSP